MGKIYKYRAPVSKLFLNLTEEEQIKFGNTLDVEGWNLVYVWDPTPHVETCDFCASRGVTELEGDILGYYHNTLDTKAHLYHVLAGWSAVILAVLFVVFLVAVALRWIE